MKVVNGQNTIYANDLPAAMRFYTALGLEESFRYPSSGDIQHIELRAGHFTLGIATVAAARDEHGLDPHPGGGGIEIVLWVDDTDGLYTCALELGAEPISSPRDFLQHLRVAWVKDLDGNPLQFVQDTREYPLSF
ncbi:MAG: VOC family protein [Thermomicrobiales bacterium]|nr:VOC family protein [Thermomicrobiales bacterium]